jgi:hypothetical protein
MQDYEIRKHYEAAIHDLAKLFNHPPRDLRESFKWYLIRSGYINHSTTELDDEELGKLADKLSIYHSRMENTPPDERGTLEFKNILLINLKEK